MNLCFLDLETTGLDPKRHEIIDVYAVQTTPDANEIVAEAGSRILPRRIDAATPRALEVNGYDPEVWAATARPWGEIWPIVRGLVEGAVLVGSNPFFDLRFLLAATDREEYPIIPPRLIDTIKMSRARHRGRRHGLDAICERYGIPYEDAHTARGDVFLALEAYRAMLRYDHS